MKNFKKIPLVLTLLSFLFVSSLFGQGWEKIYSDSIGDYSSPFILATDNGGFLVLYKLRNLPNPSDLLLTQFDKDGIPLWTKSFDDSSQLLDFEETPNGDYLIVDNSKITLISQEGTIIDQYDHSFPSMVTLNGKAGKGYQTDQNETIVIANQITYEPPFILYDDGIDTVYNIIDIDTAEFRLMFHSTEITNDNKLVILGTTAQGVASIGYDMSMAKVEFNGDTIWTKTYDDFGESKSVHGLVELPNDSLVGLVSSYGNYKLVWFDAQGELGDYKDIFSVQQQGGDYLEYMTMTSNGNFIIAWNESDGIPRIIYLDSEGEEIWRNEYGNPTSYYTMERIVEAADGNFFALGLITDAPFHNNGDIFIIKLDTLGKSWTNYIQGNIFYDNLENCERDSSELPLDGWIVSALNTDSSNLFYAVTDSLGNYEIRTDIGEYNVRPHISNAYWSTSECWNDSLVNMPTNFDTVAVDFPVQAEFDCPIVNVDISTPFLRRCFSNIYYVNYCNEGTVPADNAYIEVEFDEWLTIDSSSLPVSNVNGQIYTFNVGNIEVGACGGFQVYVTLDCDSTMLGQTHCVTAHSYPDSICLLPNQNWDGSTITVEGECLGDSILYTIQNVGANPMQETKTYIITEDVIIHLNGTFQLDVLESKQISFPVDTAYTYRLEAEQASNHPTSTAPSVTIEGCGSPNLPISLGFVNNYSQDDADPFISIDCQENIGAYDPNDKRGFPEGIGAEQIIFDHTELEYHIRFQNTGTDTAFLVVIRDTLPEFLDPATVRPGASSHPYTWTLSNNGALKFTFDNIMLPDSNINEAASHGFVKFKIKQQHGNLPGTIINNQAGIYFDFNAPVITNQTTHKILEPQTITNTDTLYFCNDLFYTQDTSIITESPQLSWNVMTNNSIILSSPYEITINDTIYTDDVFQGMQYPYPLDTTLMQNLTSIEGCDSIVTINLEVLVGIDDLPNLITDIQVFPNPARQQIHLTIAVTEATELTFILYNQLGQPIDNKRFSQQIFEGKNIIPMDLMGLADGIYFLEIKNDKGKQSVKIVVRQN